MNIFYLDHDPILAAEYAIDAHVRKMPLESCQMLCTCTELLTNQKQLYKSTHVNHPCTKWARESFANFDWLLNHTAGLLREYYYRFGKLHASNAVYNAVWEQKQQLKKLLPHKERSSPALAMPEQYKTDDPVFSYRLFYCCEKRADKRGRSMLSWTKRKAPLWFS